LYGRVTIFRRMAHMRLPLFFESGGGKVKTAHLALLILALLVLGCGGNKPEPEVDPTAEVAGAPSDAGDGSGVPEADLWLPDPQPYHMAAGDQYTVRFFYYPEYNITGTVRPDGFVTIPLVGDLNVNGLTPAQVSDSIRASYADVLAEPEVSVIITEAASRKFFIFGEVDQPGAYALDGNMTLIDAIAQAGGVKVSGRKDNIILMRKTGDGHYAARRIDLDEKVRTGDTEMTYLMATDVIFVPMSAIAKLDTFVDQFFNQLSPAWRFYILARETVNPQGGYVIGR
jgi:protein involved in polysaccharide export with SLBB domain